MITQHNNNSGIDPLQREAHQWIALFIRGDATASDLEAMKAWHAQSPAHAAAYARARRLWQSLGPVASDSMKVRRPELVAPQRRLTGRRAVLGGALAASAAGVAGLALIAPPLGLWPSLTEFAADYRTGAGEQRQVAIADQISLDLNTRTSLAIRSPSAGADSVELLAGEAMASIGDVSRPVIVIAGDGRIVAAGAKFNLRHDAGATCVVSCLEGSIEVEQGAAKAALAARQQVSYGDRGIGTVTTIDPDTVTAWRRGLLIFEFAPVARAIDEVNRYRPGRIVLLNDAIGRRILNARFRISDADKIIGQIETIFGATATFLPGGLVILT